MRILVAVDQHPYSAHVVKDVAKLAGNTWADVTLVGVGPKMTYIGQPSNKAEKKHPLTKALRNYRRNFLDYFEKEESPYEKRACNYEFVEVKRGVWEELYICRGAMKDLKIVLRSGNPVKEILAQSQEDDSDLIAMGCYKSGDCQWEGAVNIPQKVANNAACSVLVIKKEKKIRKIACCLDQENISQKSIEMINQMVTLYQTELEIVGLTDGTALKPMVEKNLDAILKYYNARQIKAWIKLVDVASMASFISQEARRSMMALWMGEHSLLSKMFPRGKVDKLIRGSESSVLLLR
ncbi:MAG: universal stress protein [Deltaproteobacteria bacterium]|nr:universal stress protein [Deltaproteobacteria bacterium]